MADGQDHAAAQTTTTTTPLSDAAKHAVDLAKTFSVDGDKTLLAIEATQKGNLKTAQEILGGEKPSSLAAQTKPANPFLPPDGGAIVAEQQNDAKLNNALNEARAAVVAGIAGGDKSQALLAEGKLFDAQALIGASEALKKKDGKDSDGVKAFAEFTGDADAAKHLGEIVKLSNLVAHDELALKQNPKDFIAAMQIPGATKQIAKDTDAANLEINSALGKIFTVDETPTSAPTTPKQSTPPAVAPGAKPVAPGGGPGGSR